ncbi:MAG: hypothetical protein HC781_15260 [Leptolyngbyaceae cyanobacterium CSU_1_4]|nr:hypothetical protein [Leptolyngbyaceae cyanobacterium CSU_1_4]
MNSDNRTDAATDAAADAQTREFQERLDRYRQDFYKSFAKNRRPVKQCVKAYGNSNEL